jgi:hypothetical protein
MQHRHDPTIKIKSAALLAAEAAFAPPRQTTGQPVANSLPTITVLRLKATTAPADCTESGPRVLTGAHTTAQLPALKVPRVFLLKQAHVESGLTQAEWPLRQVLAEEAGSSPRPGDGGAASSYFQLAKRSRKRPPPVTLVFSAIAAAGNDDGGERFSKIALLQAQAQSDPPALHSAGLAAALAEIEPVFAAIIAASGFAVEDPQVKAQWERLSQALDEIAVEIKALSTDASAVETFLRQPQA